MSLSKYISPILILSFICTALFSADPPPSAVMRVPVPSGWAACDFQTTRIVIQDIEGINENTISLEVDGTVYSYPDPTHLSWDGDSILLFTPGTSYPGNYTVDVTLLTCEDNGGTSITGPISWSFNTDLDDPYFYPDSRFPRPDTTITDLYPEISIMVRDSTSGFPLSGLCVCIESFGYFCPDDRNSGYCWETSPHITYIDSTFSLDCLGLGIVFYQEDSVTVCLRKAVDNVPQSTALCGPNWIDTTDSDLCWDFLVDRLGPRVGLIYPDNGDTIACDTLVVYFVDFSDIRINTARFYLDGNLASEGGSPYINAIGDTVYYTGTGTAEYYDEGLVTVYVNSIYDDVGNRSIHAGGDFPDWNFTVDKSPPEASNPIPADDSVALSASPIISIDLIDSIAGVLGDSTIFNIDGVNYYLGSTPGMSWDGLTATFNTGSAGLSWGDADTVEVCVTAIDRVRPDRCGPNRMNPPFCWSFMVDRGGPQAEVIDPPDSWWSACQYQPVKIWLFDYSDIDTSTIELEINGFTFYGLDHMIYEDDTLVYTPTIPFVDSDTVDVNLVHALDNLGNDLAAPIVSEFYMDMISPQIMGIDPIPGSTIGSASIISVQLMDFGSGIDETGAILSVRGNPYSWPTYFSWDGLNLDFNLGATGEVFSDGDSVLLCLEIPDLVDSDHCGPNVQDSCWSIVFDQTGPTALMVFPWDSSITACADSHIRVFTFDETGIDYSTTHLRIDGSDYFWGDPEISLDGDTIIFTPSSAFSHNDTVIVELLDLDDSLGNPLELAPLEWVFIVDIQSPNLVDFTPGWWDIVSDPGPRIRVQLEDSPAGVDPALFEIEIQGVGVSWPSPALSWDGTYLSIESELAGITFSDGDTVEMCINVAGDLVPTDLCGPNSGNIDSCWSFTIDLSGPVADLIHPLDMAFSACEYQDIIFVISDDQGVIPESISVEIDGIIYDWPDRMSWSGDSLIFTPTAPFADGDTIDLSVLEAYDSLGNALSGVFTWQFIIDLSPPVVADIDPAPGTYVSDASPTIQILMEDSISGINPTSFAIRVDGDEYVGMLPWIWWAGGPFHVETGMGGYSWVEGDTAHICVDSIADLVSENYCGPNIGVIDSCWEYYIDNSNPQAELVFPDSGVITACVDSSIKIWLSDPGGVNPDSIKFWLNGSTYFISSPRLTYSNDTLVYQHPTAWPHGDTIEFRLSRAVDYAGNALATSYDWFFIVDSRAPELLSISPSPESILPDSSLIFIFELFDDLAGIDSTNIDLDIDGTIYTIANPGVNWNSAEQEIEIDADAAGVSFSGDTVIMCINASDIVSPLWCGPNVMADSCYEYYFDRNGPLAVPVNPEDGEITACSMVNIVIRLTDNIGVEIDSIRLEVDGVEYIISDPELSYVSDSLLIFTPSVPYSEGVIDIVLNAQDISGNSLSGGPLSYSFTLDISPPVLTGQTPSLGSVVSAVSPTIGFNLTDSPAGLLESSVVLEVMGEVIHTTDTGVSWDGANFSVDAGAFGLELHDGDSVICCVSACDNPDSCGPNCIDDECWWFRINEMGPIAGIIEPLDLVVSSCDDQQIKLWVRDGNGVVGSSIHLLVNGIEYTTADPELSYDGDSLLIFNASRLWVHGETISISLTAAEDIYGSTLEAPLSWNFLVDLQPPVVEDIQPPTGTGFFEDDTLVEIILTDAPAGINRSSLSLRIGGVYYSWPHTGLSWVGDTLSFHFSDMDYYPMDGESLSVCVELLADMVGLCPPNILEDPVCATYFFDFRGPLASFLNPPDSMWNSCDYQPIEIYLADPSGLDTSSIQLTIDGTVYAWPDPHLDYIYPDLTFTPDVPWEEGRLITVTLDAANDILGNGLEDAPLELTFGLDTLPPEVISVDPADGEVVGPDYPSINSEIEDISAGIYPHDMSLIVDGMRYYISHPAVSWDGSNLSMDIIAAGITFEDGDIIEVCVDSAYDRAILCGPNLLPMYCWEFSVDDGPPVAELIWPPEDSYVSCPRESLIIFFNDPAGIEFDSLSLSVAGVVYSISDPEINVIDDNTIRFVPDSPFADGSMVIIQVLNIADSTGHSSGAGPVWGFTMDLSSPLADRFYPGIGEASSGDSISLVLRDYGSGVNEASIELTLAGIGTYIVSDPALNYSDTMLLFDPSLAGISFDDGDSAGICVSAEDMPDVCDPNVLEDECWSFYIDAGGPKVELIRPSPGTITSCADMGTRFQIIDASGIQDSSIRVRIDDVVYDITHDEITWSSPYLDYIPSTDAGHGDTVRISVFDCRDSIGNSLSETDTAGTYYLVDLEPPSLSDEFPLDGSVVADEVQPIWVSVGDYPAGVDTSYVEISINGTVFSHGDPGLYWDSGDLHFDPLVGGVLFTDGDTIEVCIDQLRDEPDTCEPNYLESPFCWEFSINLGAPIARIDSPKPNKWVACEHPEQFIKMFVYDIEGIIESSIRLSVDGTIYRISDTELDFSDTVLIYVPSIPWGHSDTIEVGLTGVTDSLGNALASPVSWRFFIDREAPIVGAPSPEDSTVISTMEEISIPLIDNESGVDISSIILNVDAIDYSIGSGLIWTGSVASLLPESLTVLPSGTTSVCVEAQDSPDYCAANLMDSAFCWTLIIDSNNPEARPISPMSEQWVSCDSTDQKLIIYLFDSNGIITDSISIRVDGVAYDYSSGTFEYEDSVLTFYPPTYWEDNDTIDVVLLEAPDSLGNPLTPLSYSFYIDLAPPQVLETDPAAGALVSDTEPIISAKLSDPGSGIDTSSLSIDIDGTNYAIGVSPALSWITTDSQLVFDPSIAGISFSGGSSVDICVNGQDRIDVCDPNRFEHCYGFSLDDSGPLLILITPDSNACSACTTGGFTVQLSDVSGIDEESIIFRVNGIPYTVDSMNVFYYPLTGYLDFVPSEPWEDGDIMYVDSFYVSDDVGNTGEDLLEFAVYIDLGSPVIGGLYPIPTSVVTDPHQTISCIIADSGCGVNPSTIRFTVEDTLLTIDSSGVYYYNDTLRFEPGEFGMTFSDSDTVEVCILGVADAAEYCTPNSIEGSTCWWFTINAAGPMVEPIEPLPGQWIACPSGEQYITLLVEDAEGINESTIRLAVDGIPYSTDSSGLSYNPATDILTYIPTDPWEDGDSIPVSMVAVDDSAGHALASPLSYFFRVDLSGPETTFVHPILGVAIHPGLAFISVGLTDRGAGIDDTSLGINVGGVWHNIGDPGVSWIDDSLIYDGSVTDDTLFPGDTIEICVRGFDLTELCGPNNMSICWNYIMTANGPFAEPITPEAYTVTSCTDSAILIHLSDMDGDPVRPFTIRGILNGDTIYGYPRLIYDPSDSTLTVNHLPFEHGDTVFISITEAQDVWGTPLSAPLDYWFVVDTLPPQILSGYPAYGGSIVPGVPDMQFFVEDFPAGIDHSIGQIEIGGYSYSIGSGTFWEDDTLKLPSSAYSSDTLFIEGDSVVLRITLADSAQNCGENTTTIEWWFNVGATPPESRLISPPDGAITSCDSGNIAIMITDSDGLDYESCGIVVDEIAYYGIGLFVSDSLLFFHSDESFNHGDTASFWPIAADIYGSEMMEYDTSTFIVDLRAPLPYNEIPVDLSKIYDWQNSIEISLVDSIAGIIDSSINMIITTPRWTKSFTPGSLGVSWNDTTLLLDVPAYNGGEIWSPAMDDSLIYWHEREIITIEIEAKDNACCCGPNDTTFSWQFTILDDDTLGPTCIASYPDSAWVGRSIYISAILSDTSGIFEDSVYLIWDTDSSLGDGGESIFHMDEISPDSFVSETEIGPFDVGDNPVFVVVAYDNDFDFLENGDRSKTICDTIWLDLMISEGPIAELLYPDNGSFSSCNEGEVIIGLSDIQGVDVSTIELQIAGDTLNVGTNLIYRNDSLIWQPQSALPDGYEVLINLLRAEDILGFSLDSIYSWSYRIDITPPSINLIQYEESIPLGVDPTVIWEIEDWGSGVNRDSILLFVREDTLDVNGSGVDYIPPQLHFNALEAGYEFGLNYPITVCIKAADLALNCGNNTSDTICVTYKMIKETRCDVWPIPFTPNSDGANDVVWFEYPDMELNGADLQIFDLEGRKIYETNFPVTSPESDAFWNGIRHDSKKAIPGTYIYIITRNGELICKGSLLLVR